MKFKKYINEKTNMQVAKTIRKQIGEKALMMMGAKDFVAGDDYLAFKIGRNSKGINAIRITLNKKDYYDIEFAFSSVRGFKVKHEATNVPVDALHDTIEQQTGMYLSM